MATEEVDWDDDVDDWDDDEEDWNDEDEDDEHVCEGCPLVPSCDGCPEIPDDIDELYEIAEEYQIDIDGGIHAGFLREAASGKVFWMDGSRPDYLLKERHHWLKREGVSTLELAAPLLTAGESLAVLADELDEAYSLASPVGLAGPSGLDGDAMAEAVAGIVTASRRVVVQTGLLLHDLDREPGDKPWEMLSDVSDTLSDLSSAATKLEKEYGDDDEPVGKGLAKAVSGMVKQARTCAEATTQLRSKIDTS